jgi:hypothetical protein
MAVLEQNKHGVDRDRYDNNNNNNNCCGVTGGSLKMSTPPNQSHLVPPAPISSYQAVNGQITHWTSSYIEDVLFNEMCERGPIIDDPGILSKKVSGGKVNYYYLEAAKYAGRISVCSFDDDGANAKHKPSISNPLQ